MKNCDLLHQNLIDYVEKTLPSTLMLQIDEHVAGCSTCSKLVNAMIPILETVAKEKNIKVKPYVATRILQGVNNYIDQHPQTGLSTFFELKPAYATVLVIAAIGLGIAMGSFHSLAKLKAGQQVVSEIQIRNDLNVPEFTNDSFFDFSE